MKKQITSTTNPKVKEWSQLLLKKGRDKQGKYLLEGIHLVSEAIQSDAEIECIIYSVERGIPHEIPKDSRSDYEWIGVSETVLQKCSDTVTSQGIIAVVHKSESNIETLLKDEQPLVIAVDGVQDPGNLGTIIRSADAVGATGVVIGKGSVDLYNAKVIRAAMGSTFHIPVIEAELDVVLSKVKLLGVNIYSTSLQAQRNCYEEDFTQGAWFVVGNEGQGVSSQYSSYINREIIIPMKGQAESLNVAMATTILLYEAYRQRDFV